MLYMSSTPGQYCNIGSNLCFKDSIICTSWLVAAYLSDVLKYEGSTYIVGEPALSEELKLKGLRSTGPGVSNVQGLPVVV